MDDNGRESVDIFAQARRIRMLTDQLRLLVDMRGTKDCSEIVASPRGGPRETMFWFDKGSPVYEIYWAQVDLQVDRLLADLRALGLSFDDPRQSVANASSCTLTVPAGSGGTSWTTGAVDSGKVIGTYLGADGQTADVVTLSEG